MDKKSTLQIKAIRSLYPSLFARLEFQDFEILEIVSRCPDFSYRLFLLDNIAKSLDFFNDVILPKGEKYDLVRYRLMSEAFSKFVYSMTDGIWLPF